MRLSGISSESTVDGPGLRFVIFTQGCPHECDHCHNPESWSCEAGKEFSSKEIIRMMRKQCKSRRGITFSGGEPFLQPYELLQVAEAAKEMDLDVVTYTGFTYEQIIGEGDPDKIALLQASDILIDGQYKHNLRDIGLRFRGSANQRVIDVVASQKQGQVMLWEDKMMNN